MKVVIQKVKNASVLIDNNKIEKINKGFLVLIGIHKDDTEKDIDYVIRKIINLRIFEKDNKMTLSLKDIEGEILLVSNFTLYANTKNGNRPSFEESMNYKDAKNIYDTFLKEIKKEYNKVKSGSFGSYMEVSLINDGPVTIIIDSKENSYEK